MRHTLKCRIVFALLLAAPLVGTTLAPGCVETGLLALNPCGTVLNCSPESYYATIWPLITAPDYERDPSCTIPYGCGSQGTDFNLWFGTAARLGFLGAANN